MISQFFKYLFTWYAGWLAGSWPIRTAQWAASWVLAPLLSLKWEPNVGTCENHLKIVFCTSVS